MDELLEVIDVNKLAQDYGVSRETMRKRLLGAGGRIFKLGKRLVIRKVSLLEVIEALERDASLVA